MQRRVEPRASKGLASRVRHLLRRVQHLEPVDPEQWYVVLDGEFHGPVSRATLVEVLAEHDDDLDAPLWSAAHAEEWTTMLGVPGLAGEVAACRADAGHEHAHPSDVPPFAESVASPPPSVAPSNSGEVDIAAALASISAKGAPVRAELLSDLVITGAGDPRVPWAGPERRHRSPRERRAWLGTGIAMGMLAVAALVAPFVDTRPPPLADDASAAVPVAPAPVAWPVAAAEPVALAPERVAPVVVEEPRPVAPAAAAPRIEARRRSAPASIPASAPAVASEPVAPSEPAPSLAPEVAPSTAPPARTMDELLVAAAPPEPARAPAPPMAAREVPTDAEVVAALESTREWAAACTPVHAVAALRLTIHGPTGMVRGVYVDGVFAGTPTGSCIARAVRRARVAPFSQPTFAYSYPFRL